MALDAPGIDLGDLAVIGPEIVTIGAEIAGNIIGFAKGGPVGSVFGGAAGAAGGKAVSIEILKFLGILDDEDISTGQEAILSGGLAAIGGAIPFVGTAGRRLLSSEIRAADELANLGITPTSIREGREILRPLVEDVEKATGITPKFSTGQAVTQKDPVGGEILQRIESQGGFEGGIDVARQQLAVRGKLNENIVGDADKNLLGARDVGDEIKQVATKRIEDARLSGQTEIDTAIEKAQSDLDRFASSDTTNISSNVRGILQEGRDKVFSAISKQYDEVTVAVGDVRVDVAEFRTMAKKLDKAEILLPSLSRGRKALTEEAKKAGLEVVTKKGKKQTTDIGASFEATRTALSDMRAELRRLETIGAPKSQRDSLQNLHDSLLSSRNDSLLKLDPKLADDILKADEQWAIAKSRLDTGLVGRIINNTDGRFKIKDTKVFNNLIDSGDSIDEIMSVAGDFPGLNVVGDMKSAYLAKYADEVIEGPSSHIRFMLQNELKMKRMFTPQEMKKFSNANISKKFVETRAAQEKLLAERIKNEFGFDIEIGKFSPEGLIDDIASNPKTSLERTRKLKTMLETDHPDKWKSYVSLRKRKLANSIFDEQGELNIKSLDTMLANDRGELTVSMGKNYVKNLRLVRDFIVAENKKGVKAAGQEAFSRGDLGGDTFSFLKFMIFGPLDRAGARFNRADVFRASRSARAAQRIIQDDEMLERLVTNALGRAKRAPVIIAMSALGLNVAVGKARKSSDLSSVPEITSPDRRNENDQ